MNKKKNNILSLFLVSIMAISIFVVMTANSIVMAEVNLKTVDDSDENIIYTNYFPAKHELAYEKTIHWDGNIVGASIEYSFYGTYISVLTVLGVGANFVEVSIDGVLQGEYDSYSDTPKGEVPLFTKADLANGLHTINVVSMDKINEKNVTGEFHAFQFDGFVVEANPVIAEKTAQPTTASTSSLQNSAGKTSAPTSSPQKSTDQTAAKTTSPKNTSPQNTENSEGGKSNGNNTLIIVLIVVLAGIGVVTFVVMNRAKFKRS